MNSYASFNIDAEDLQSADVEFSFWQGRRINIASGTDLSIHHLRFNDIVQGILAEDAIFEEGEDKQQIYTALGKLKDAGYPYTGPLQIRIMLCFKQLVGNFYRQELLDQLENKLCEEIQEPSSSEISSSESTDDELEPPKTHICDPTFQDVLPMLFTYVGRRWYRPLLTTCMLFHKIITTTTNLDLKTMHRDFHLLKRCFKLDVSQQSRNEISLLLQEFNAGEVKLNPRKELKYFEKNYFTNDFIKKYKKRYLEYAIALAKIDAKSALKIVTAIVTPGMEWVLQALAFCAWAAIHKNSTLCDKAKVLQMGEEVYKYRQFDIWMWDRRDQRFLCLMALFEAYLGFDNDRAVAILRDIKTFFIIPEIPPGSYLQTTAKMIKKHHPLEENINQEAVCLLSKNLELDFFAQAENNQHEAESLAIIAKTLILIDREKGILALDRAIEAVKNCSKLNKIKSLILIAEAYNEFDQEQAFKVAQQAYDALTASLYLEEKGLKLYTQPIRPFDYLNRIIKIFATRNKEYASKVFYENMDKLHAALGITGGKSEYYSHGFYANTFRNLFTGTLEVFVLLDPQEARKTVKRCVELLKTDEETSVNDTLDLLNALAKYFPDEALELAADLHGNFKCQVLMSIVRKSIDSKIAKSYVERTLSWIYTAGH